MHAEFDLPDSIGSLPMEFQVELDDDGVVVTFYLTVCVCGEHAKVYLPLPIPGDVALDAVLYVAAGEGWLPPIGEEEPVTPILTDGFTTGAEVKMVRRDVRTAWGNCDFTFDPHDPSNMTVFGGNL